MAFGLSGRFRNLPILAATAFGLVGFFTFLGYIYERFKKIDYKDDKTDKKIQGKKIVQETQVEQKIEPFPQGELSSAQLEHLINAIGTVEDSKLESLLITISNSCAFTHNQVKISEWEKIAAIM